LIETITTRHFRNLSRLAKLYPWSAAPREDTGTATDQQPKKDPHVMKTSFLIGSALAAALALPAIVNAQAGPAPVPDFQAEKCYGIVKAGKNDCQTANSSCAGTSRRDNQGDAWIYVPAGSCERIVGASLQPKQA
jgi:uncharacterized membrane protein